MPYRDELEALRAQKEALSEQLADQDEELARLRAGISAAERAPGLRRPSWAPTPTTVPRQPTEFRRLLGFSIVLLLAAVLLVGPITQAGGAFGMVGAGGLLIMAIDALRRARHQYLHLGRDGLTIVMRRDGEETIVWNDVVAVRVVPEIRGQAVVLTDLRNQTHWLRGYRMDAHELAFAIQQWREWSRSLPATAP